MDRNRQLFCTFQFWLRFCGMAPEWTRATRPLVLIYSAIGFALTLLFRADVDAQGGAYATGVLVLMTSAAVAVTLSVWRGPHRVRRVCFGLIALVFVYTTLVNAIERTDGLKIGGFFIAAIVLSSLVSRVWRTTELRVKKITLDREAQRVPMFPKFLFRILRNS
jgi:hypothetical protein